ncbi:hypothetical protein L195_g038743 [Trifolium pratense]|uniref:Uncharacterized protein n=1 Tax=Trifolium pratense TaxID=57577 RepID=A0A2K3LVZ5_TRIPR|nr:hypothetical protein L195_g038743 [Trifolium pratense]
MRGWGGSAKQRRLRLFLQKGAFDVCLQERKKASYDDYLIHNLWGHKDVDWVVKESDGLSGVSQHFTLFGDIAKGKNSKWFRHIIWLATTWCI